ncbi:universal stress protein [Acidovorax sp. CCYZU-2555]|uniref:universal stress protein n=1 Tax=Acidovorax sp. CCYZU-2555 TaxID=2835042 RepID=UPI001BCB8C51|nr:universal stress protein [Acidovorax sp. CCYZU-2555]MBS7779489.1 universal stress protein [Acidovorax sp. CCYZU-2555]
MYQRILIATDGSPLSDQAIESGLSLAALCKASVVVVKVVPLYSRSYLEGGDYTSIDDVKRIEDQWVHSAQQLLNGIIATGEARGVPVKTSVIKSDLVAETLIDVAREQGADLIVMASHGRKGLKRLLLGSETQHVLTHSTVPVLVLR